MTANLPRPPVFTETAEAQAETAVEPSEPAPAPTEPAPELPIAVRELLDFNPRYITGLPLATTLVCRRQDGGGGLVITTSRVAHEAARRAGVPVFVGSEIEAIVTAAENERGTPAACAQWCEQKALNPGWRLSVEAALGGVRVDGGPKTWPLRHVLWVLGLELVAVGCGDEVPGEIGSVGKCQADKKGHDMARAG